jgi:hypothetical protein
MTIGGRRLEYLVKSLIANRLLSSDDAGKRTRLPNLAIRVGRLDRTLLALAFGLVLYLQFYAVFSTIGWHPRLGLERWGITPERVSFVVVLVVTVAFAFRLRLTRLSPGRMSKFQSLIEDLLWSEKFPELLTLLQQNLNQLVKIADDRFLFSRSGLLPTTAEEMSARFLRVIRAMPDGDSRTEPETDKFTVRRQKLSRIAKQLPSWAVRVLPDYSDARTVAREVIHTTLTSKKLATVIAHTRPYFGLELLQLRSPDVPDFLNNYLRALLADRSSVLYYEIRNNQQVGAAHAYEYPGTNRLLHFLFSDAKTAERLMVWMPVGEAIIEELNGLGRQPTEDPYNLPAEREFTESGCWVASLFAGVSFFDLMVTSAVWQGLDYHMWLYYFTFFVDRVAANYQPRILLPGGPQGEPRYDLLLRQIFSTLRDWVEVLRDIPSNQENIALRDISVEPQNNNIPKSSIIALGQCLRTLLTAERIPDQFKHEELHVVYNLYFDLVGMGAHRYAEVLLLVLRPGAIHTVVDEVEYVRQLAAGFDDFDQFPHRMHRPEDLERLENIVRARPRAVR